MMSLEGPAMKQNWLPRTLRRKPELTPKSVEKSISNESDTEFEG